MMEAPNPAWRRTGPGAIGGRFPGVEIGIRDGRADAGRNLGEALVGELLFTGARAALISSVSICCGVVLLFAAFVAVLPVVALAATVTSKAEPPSTVIMNGASPVRMSSDGTGPAEAST